jgi:predicted RNA-binding Zn ribbon-like protein
MAEAHAVPDVLVTLANLGRPRRASGVRALVTEPVLPDVAGAREQLSGLTVGPVTNADLPALRRLQAFAAEAAAAILAGRMPDPAPLNALASDSQARLRLLDSGGTLRQELLWKDGSSAAQLARRLITELVSLDSTRLRKCARPQCTLLFYDTTRSRTRRWHAEDPCGWRERDHARRATLTAPHE